MAQQNVVVIGFTEPSKAYQALSVLKSCNADGRIGLESAAVVERTPEGTLRIPESADNAELVGMASGSVVGMLIGVLGGPVGMLLGWGAGAMMGGAFDLDRAVTSDEALTVLGTAIPAGSTAVIANVEEPAVEVIDGEMAKLGGEVTRRPVADVMAELDAAEAAADAAAREARKVVRQQKKAEFDEHVAKTKEKLKISCSAAAAVLKPAVGGLQRLWDQTRTRSARGRIANSSGATSSNASPSIPAWTGEDAITSTRVSVQARAPGGSRTRIPRRPLSSAGRVPGGWGGPRE